MTDYKDSTKKDEPCWPDNAYDEFGQVAIMDSVGRIKGVNAYTRSARHKNEDEVNSPNRYTKGDIECIVYIKDLLSSNDPKYYTGFLWGTLFPYLHRWLDKGEVESLKKARKYLDWLIEYQEELNERSSDDERLRAK